MDLLVAGEDLRDVFRTREAYEFQGRRIVTVTLDGLARMKRRAGRPQDLADLDNLGLGREETDV